MKDVRKKVKELSEFYKNHYYLPIETIRFTDSLKKSFQRRRAEGIIERVYASRSQVINYGPLRYSCKQYPNRRQFSLYHINDILKIIPLKKFMNLDNFEGINRIFTMIEAEQLTGVDRSTIKVWIKRYSLPIEIIGNAYQFKYDDLKMIERLKGKTPQEKTYIIQMQR